MNQEKAPFSSLARVYDAIFADVEYDDWCEFALETLHSLGWLENPKGTTMLDVACGTGSSSVPYVRRGLVVSGADISADMLEVARSKLPEVTFYQQGFLELQLDKRFELITCVFDSLNNLLSLTDLELALQKIRAHLTPNGIFVFDCNTPLGVTDLWDDNEFMGDVTLPDGSAHYHWTHQALESDLGEVTAQIWLMDTQGALLEEFTEIHLERGFSPAQLTSALHKAGFSDVQLLEYPDSAPVTDQTPRFWGFARA